MFVSLAVWLGLLAACTERPACVRADELLESCLYEGSASTEPSSTYDSGFIEYSCTEGTVSACRAGCVVVAVESQGCAGVYDQFKNSDYLKCSVNCEDKGSK